MKIYLAGLEQEDTLQLLKEKLIENGFISFYYERKHKKSLMPVVRKGIKNVIVDSGAHTFFSEMTYAGLSVSVHKKKTKTKETGEEYFTQYKEWLLKNSNYYDYFVELDIGELVGQKKVLEWREELKKLGLYDRCITVYHPDIMTFQDYIDTLEDSQSKFVALEGDRPQHRKRLPYLRLIKEGFNRKVRMHGFAMTKDDAFLKFPFYSVDSTSWKAGVMYGVAKVITAKKKIKNIKFKDKNAFSKIGNANATLIHNKVLNIARYARYVLSINAYKKIEKEITRIWEARGIIW